MNTLCEWPVDYAACTSCKSALNKLGEDDQEKFERMAAEFLWSWTNRVFGVCDAVIRPCSAGCEGGWRWMSTFWGRGPYPWMGSWDSGSWVPVLIAGEWFNVRCGCVSSCTCSIDGPSSLVLPGPIASITQVKINGVVLDPSSYRVAYNRTLVRTDGQNWPACQNLLAESSEDDTFEVSYKRGIPVPVGGQIAAGILAGEFAKAACNDQSCQLPARIREVTRQDVHIVLDDFKDLEKGGTGIWLIDSWVQSVVAPKPYASVRSVDVKPKAAMYGY